MSKSSRVLQYAQVRKAPQIQSQNNNLSRLIFLNKYLLLSKELNAIFRGNNINILDCQIFRDLLIPLQAATLLESSGNFDCTDLAELWIPRPQEFASSSSENTSGISLFNRKTGLFWRTP